MSNSFYYDKGKLNDKYSINKYIKESDIAESRLFYENVLNKCRNFEKKSYLEISHVFTPAYKFMLNEFKAGTFLSDDAFESLLVYHYSSIENKNIAVYNHKFSENSFSNLKFKEEFDFIFSIFGISFNNLYSLLPQIINFLKINGIFAVVIPCYWFLREKLTEEEKIILNYSKQNDKKWVFADPLDPIIEENGGKNIGIFEIDIKKILTRLELSYLSSLNKLYDAVVGNNIAHIEVSNIPEKNISLRSAVLIIQKHKTTLTKDNLFKI